MTIRPDAVCTWDRELRAYLHEGYGGDLSISGGAHSVRIETPCGISVEAPTLWQALVAFAHDPRVAKANAEVRDAMRRRRVLLEEWTRSAQRTTAALGAVFAADLDRVIGGAP